MNRPKYKELLKQAVSDYAKCQFQLQDCECFIKEAKKFICDHNLQEEFNEIMNTKYGMTLASTILLIR